MRARLFLICILLFSAFLRFYNLMHDEPYFFNPDERNMAIAITQFSLPANLWEIPACIFSEFFRPTTNQPRLARRESGVADNLPSVAKAMEGKATSCSLNPHFFAYGQFPLYLSFISDQVKQQLSNTAMKLSSIIFPALVSPSLPSSIAPSLTTSFPSAIFWLRFYSALSSTLTVLLVFSISKSMTTCHPDPERSEGEGSPSTCLPAGRDSSAFGLRMTSYIPHFAALLAAFTPGLIQSAHFGTTESLLTFFFMGSVYASVCYLRNLSRLGHLRFIALTSLTIGLALGSKLTGLFFLVPPAISLLIQISQLFLKKMKFMKRARLLFINYLIGLTIIISSLSVAIISSPYNLVEPNHFLSAVFGYEADVATGKYPAFYTRQFIGTTPILFQIDKIFPHQLGRPIFIVGSAGFLLFTVQLVSWLISVVRQSIKYKVASIKKIHTPHNFPLYFILYTSYLVYFFPNAFLFAKWTRFMTPLLPFFSIFAVLFIVQVIGNLSHWTHWSNWKLGYWLIGLLVFISVLPGLAFFSIYTRDDSRVTASRWIYDNIPDGSYILSETANVIDIPLGLPSNETMKQWNNTTVISFDFYHLNESPQLVRDLYNHLARADYIFIPSRRIFANHLPHPDRFPQAARYYNLLFSGQLGFEKVAEISSFPQLVIGRRPMVFPDETAEETSTVFDHPVIRIYKKIKQIEAQNYQQLMEK